MSYDPTLVRQTNYDVSWDAGGTPYDLGGVDDVRLSYGLILKAVKVGSAGELKLNDRFNGLTDDSNISCIVREVTLARIRKLVPWAAGAGAISLTPPVGTLLAQYGKQLLLHPRDKGVATDEDVLAYVTVPVQSFKLPRNGADFDRWEVMFNVYPDLTKLNAGQNAYLEIKGA